MRKIKRVLELHFVANLSNQAIARSVGESRASVSQLPERAAIGKLTWPFPEQMSGAELEAILDPTTVQDASVRRPVPNWSEVCQGLAKHRSLTLHQLWKGYIAAHPTGYQYSRFCELYRRWRSSQVDPVMRPTHKVGERLFVDYSRKMPCIADPVSGEVREVEWFVAELGAFDICIGSHRDAKGSVFFKVFGDRLSSRWSALLTCRTIWKPPPQMPQVRFADSERTFPRFDRELQWGVRPASPRRRIDKAKAENGVILVHRRVLEAL